MRSLHLLIPLALVFAAANARAADLLAGPMLGHATPTSARVWLQFSEPGQLTINAIDVSTNRGISGVRLDIDGPAPFIADVPITNLEADKSYRIDVKFDGQVVKTPPFTLRTAPVPGDEVAFSVAAASSLEVSPYASAPAGPVPIIVKPDNTPHAIFTAINGTKPRAFFFLGNTGHLPNSLDEFPTTHRAAFKFLTDFHATIRKLPDMQQLLSSTPTYGIFSDHDFGPANADSSFVFAQESLIAFQKFWPNPDWGTPETPGCFTSLSLADVDFFLLDARTYRDPHPTTAPAGAPGKPLAMLGNAQLDWLKTALKSSKANFKILAAPCTLWGDSPAHPDVDSWSNFPGEQNDFIDWLAAEKIHGILALVGNHPAAELTRFTPQNFPYPLYTLATSSLTLPPGARLAAAADNPLRISRPFSECTFATLDFSGTLEHRFVTLRLRDEKGKTQTEQTIFAVQLKN